MTQRIAVVHEWLTSYAGSEHVLEQILTIYPRADLFAVADFLPQSARTFLNGRPVRTTFLQHAPLARKHLQKYLWLMPLAIEGLDLRGYDIVISSSHAVAKGVLTGPDQFHLCYCHSPMRYAWDLQAQYLEQAGLGRRGPGRALARLLLHYMRLWDSRTANGVDHFVANSAYIACRIRKVYQREAAVLPPPVDVDSFQLPRAGADHAGGFYLAVSRMVPYKRVDTIVTAFSRQLSGKRLVVVGDGPLRRKCERIAAPNVEFLGHVDSSRLIALLQSADALVYSAEEDFGITMAEALACGTPVIAYGRGGSLEIVEEGVTGVLFDRQDPEAIADAVEHFERTRALLRPERMRSSVERLHPREFRRSFEELVSHAFAVWDANRTTRHVGGVGAAP